LIYQIPYFVYKTSSIEERHISMEEGLQIPQLSTSNLSSHLVMALFCNTKHDKSFGLSIMPHIQIPCPSFFPDWPHVAPQKAHPSKLGIVRWKC
jgi:hypothetical protein